MNKHNRVNVTNIKRVVPDWTTRYALTKMLEEHCHTTGKTEKGDKVCAYDPPWNDKLIFEQFGKLHPEAGEVTQIIVQHTRLRMFGELPASTTGRGRFGGFADALRRNADELASLKARVDALEEWATSRKTAPFQPGDGEDDI
jgi:hypothetical protein